jgi:hypothetical protein
MSCDYSISLNGIYAAERHLLQSAKRIATVNPPDPEDVVAINQAKFAVKANLKVISTQQEIDREALDLFA